MTQQVVIKKSAEWYIALVLFLFTCCCVPFFSLLLGVINELNFPSLVIVVNCLVKVSKPQNVAVEKKRKKPNVNQKTHNYRHTKRDEKKRDKTTQLLEQSSSAIAKKSAKKKSVSSKGKSNLQ